jgi:ArsR family transcriptional regulator
MDRRQALNAFGALSQDTRLAIVRLLVKAGPEGIPAGEIADEIGVSASNMSFHLKELERAGLATTRRESRSIIYAADYSALGGLVRFLMQDCCAGHPDICAPALDPCCAPTPRKAKARRPARV